MGHQMDERHDYAMFLLNEVHIPLDRPLNIDELVIPAEAPSQSWSLRSQD